MDKHTVAPNLAKREEGNGTLYCHSFGLVNPVLSKFKEGKLDQEAEATEYSGT